MDALFGRVKKMDALLGRVRRSLKTLYSPADKHLHDRRLFTLCNCGFQNPRLWRRIDSWHQFGILRGDDPERTVSRMPNAPYPQADKQLHDRRLLDHVLLGDWQDRLVSQIVNLRKIRLGLRVIAYLRTSHVLKVRPFIRRREQEGVGGTRPQYIFRFLSGSCCHKLGLCTPYPLHRKL